ncbi:MAG: hypothetical protein HY670_12030 [Chloroflexi bacterium]|nr:hypothetical protein [Chloroflexota bacterium]
MGYSHTIFSRIMTDHKRLVVVLFFLFAFGILAVSVTFFALSIGRPYMGISLAMDKDDWTVQSVDANGIARRAGIGVGDRPVEVNGQPAEVFLQKYEKAGVVFGLWIKELTVIDGRGRSKSASMQNSSPSLQSLIDQSARLTVSILFWVVGLYVFVRRPRNVAALVLFLSGLAFGLSFSGLMAASVGVPMAGVFHVAASVIGPWLLLHFFLVLPEERARLRASPLVYLIYLPAAITLVLFPLVGYADGQPVQWFRTIRLFEYGAGFLAAVSVVIFNYLRAASVRTRQQMKIVLIGCLCALVPFLVLYIFPQAIWRRSVIPPEFGMLLIAFIPLSMGYAVITQKLMDIDIVIRRGVIYALITLVMALVLSAAIFVVVVFPKSLGVPEEILLALVLGGAAAALFGPAKKGAEALVDRLFYKDRYDYRQAIHVLSSSLSGVKDFVEISRVVVGTTVEALNLAGACLFVKASDGTFEVGTAQGTFSEAGRVKQLASLIARRTSLTEFPNPAYSIDVDVAFLVPLVAGEQEIGVLCLSCKTSRQDFSPDDIYLVQGIASVAGIALRSAMLVRDVSIRDTFVSMASHELRTPLTSIMGYTELLLSKDPPAATRKQWLRNVYDNSQRVAAMIDDLLNVTRIQSGRVTVKLDKLKLSDVLEEQLALARESTAKHEFAVDIRPDVPEVLADRDKFGQVVGNLLSNAIKYSPEGGRVALAARYERGHRRVVLSIADQGIGIGPADRESLFTTFHRIHRPETQGVRGSGLGLYIVKEWLKMMGAMSGWRAS